MRHRGHWTIVYWETDKELPHPLDWKCERLKFYSEEEFIETLNQLFQTDGVDVEEVKRVK
jgi:hypothetical protein